MASHPSFWAVRDPSQFSTAICFGLLLRCYVCYLKLSYLVLQPYVVTLVDPGDRKLDRFAIESGKPCPATSLGLPACQPQPTCRSACRARGIPPELGDTGWQGRASMIMKLQSLPCRNDTAIRENLGRDFDQRAERFRRRQPSHAMMISSSDFSVERFVIASSSARAVTPISHFSFRFNNGKHVWIGS